MTSPNQAELASGTSANAKADALTTIRVPMSVKTQEFPGYYRLTKVVDRKLGLALSGSLVEHLTQLLHSVHVDLDRQVVMRHLGLALEQSLADRSSHVGDGEVLVLCRRNGRCVSGKGGDARGGCLGDLARLTAGCRGTLELFNVGLVIQCNQYKRTRQLICLLTLTIRPSGPVPLTWLNGMPLSSANFLANGLAKNLGLSPPS